MLRSAVGIAHVLQSGLVMHSSKILTIQQGITRGVSSIGKPHSEKKGYQNGAPGVLLLQMVHVYETVPLGHRGTEIVPLRVPYYGQPNSAPRGTVLVPFFF